MKKGFTLIELSIVIGLIAILAVVLAPRLRDQIAKAKDTEAISVLGALRSISETYYVDEQEKTYEGELSAMVSNSFSEPTDKDKIGLNKVIPKLNIQGMNIFGGNNDWEPKNGYRAEIGGARESIAGKVKYSGDISYTFHAPVGSSADGINLWFTKYTLSPDGLEFDTKGLKWIEY